MNYAQQSAQLAGPMALNKFYLARCGQEISDDTVQIFGGRGITQTGMGALIEQYQRTYKCELLFLFLRGWRRRKDGFVFVHACALR